ncbi:MAG: uncharacterized protein QG665_479 [Patescibacteria group bacterium]|nr:uncharacterized protein [Patescibacteria group bacterium]
MYVQAKVHAGASADKLVVIGENRLEIWVRAKARAGAANLQVVNLVAKFMAKSPKEVRIINGHNSPSKLLAVKD